MNPIPPGAVYAVIAEFEDTIAWCPNIESVLAAMRQFGPDLCGVTRLEDNRPIWPWKTKGGDC